MVIRRMVVLLAALVAGCSGDGNISLDRSRWYCAETLEVVQAGRYGESRYSECVAYRVYGSERGERLW